MSRPKLLDLFCGAGGCSVGYDRAGFDVTGVDIEDHPDYPYELVVHDAMDVLAKWPRFLKTFDVIHASPPCQAYTTMANRKRLEHPDLLAPTFGLLAQWGGPWVVENVAGARRHMPHYSLTLHGGMFGLGVNRPRIFATNMPMLGLEAPPPVNPIGVYGQHPDGRRLFTRANSTVLRAAASLEEAQSAMQIDWMTDWRHIAEAVPPAYTEYIGAQLLDALERVA